jgi:hypothetical protein
VLVELVVLLGLGVGHGGGGDVADKARGNQHLRRTAEHIIRRLLGPLTTQAAVKVRS